MGSGARHNEKGVYLTLCLRRAESCKFKIKVLNIATVDVPGVIISTPCGIVQVIVASFGCNVSYRMCHVWFGFHIGVGF